MAVADIKVVIAEVEVAVAAEAAVAAAAEMETGVALTKGIWFLTVYILLLKPFFFLN